jgi:hypothetical protein
VPCPSVVFEKTLGHCHALNWVKISTDCGSSPTTSHQERKEVRKARVAEICPSTRVLCPQCAGDDTSRKRGIAAPALNGKIGP